MGNKKKLKKKKKKKAFFQNYFYYQTYILFINIRFPHKLSQKIYIIRIIIF